MGEERERETAVTHSLSHIHKTGGEHEGREFPAGILLTVFANHFHIYHNTMPTKLFIQCILPTHI